MSRKKMNPEGVPIPYNRDTLSLFSLPGVECQALRCSVQHIDVVDLLGSCNASTDHDRKNYRNYPRSCGPRGLTRRGDPFRKDVISPSGPVSPTMNLCSNSSCECHWGGPRAGDRRAISSQKLSVRWRRVAARDLRATDRDLRTTAWC
jgi:hypothetical protein